MDRLAADRMFAQVVRLGGFSAAAAQLGTSAGQASKLVSRLEAHLGVRLLTRSTRAIALTAEGEAYFAGIAAILDDLADLEEGLRETGANPRGQLRLTAPLTFGTVQLMPALIGFGRLHPGIALDVQFTDSVMSLAEHGFDAAIRVGTPRDSALLARKLGVMRTKVAAAPAYLDARGTPGLPDDLTGHRIITDTNFARPDHWSFRQDGQSRTIFLPGQMRLSNAEACAMAAEAGLGIARLPDFIAARAIAEGRLVEILAPFRDGDSGVFALTPAARHMPVRLRLLLDHLRALWGPDHDWLA
ncbi:LysR family transcriptional regulator [Paracoccus spongiarum]|uniref:LysR substrate-binding domain-containing protein n=1 Tax=Paracoccus spongiarum TaxID=3064387 RepID=A0ABT9J9T8_9RHOB|nr:LysR family transcriptional regulator [Paracoccus sp. 2205BS29-5]MDP5305851.1 LysR substrate-binding domain-containing protein [Paracoccus sp. 2205BS29-5]